MFEFRELTYLSIICRILLAIGIGGIVGIERESKHQPAGARTYMLVCLGACLIMMTNQYICVQFQTGDPSRLGAQVISGIGFLGAGTILVTRNNQVRGLTTAAGLWAAACIGLAIGIGFYEGAILAGGVLLFIMIFFQKIDDRIQMRSKYIKLYLNFSSNIAMTEFMKACRAEQLKIIDMQISKLKGDSKGGVVVFLTMKGAHKCEHTELIERLSCKEGVKHIEEV